MEILWPLKATFELKIGFVAISVSRECRYRNESLGFRRPYFRVGDRSRSLLGGYRFLLTHYLVPGAAKWHGRIAFPHFGSIFGWRISAILTRITSRSQLGFRLSFVEARQGEFEAKNVFSRFRRLVCR